MSNKEPKKKKRFDYSMQRANSTHVTILCLIGLYLFYLAHKMYQNTVSGASSMSMTTTVILIVVMCLVGLAIIGYACFVWYKIRKSSELSEEESAQLDQEMAKADLEKYGKIVGDYDTDVSRVEEAYDEALLSGEDSDEN